jgi:hypothetical protein
MFALICKRKIRYLMNKRMMKRKIQLIPVMFIYLFMVNCNNTNHTDNQSKTNDTTEKTIEKKEVIKIERFDQDILSLVKDSSMNSLNMLRTKYGTFLDSVFCKQIMKIWTRNDKYLITNILNFINDVDIQRIYSEVNVRCKNMDDIEKEYNDAIAHYRTLFPGKLVPRIYTMVNAFNYSVIAIDSAVVVGLELYLGSDCPFYTSLQYPMYKIHKLRREYIVRDAMECWLKSDYDNTVGKHDLVSQMVYKGKILYTLDKLLPDADDTIKTGFTKKQMEWCKSSEGAIWTFFIEKKLLFSTNETKYESYINDGPTSKGMPKESPANAGSWIGWQIVKKYMKEHPEISIKQLLENMDAQKILNDSKYKPQV